MAHMKRAEELVMSNSITDLVDNTESLYYALYARLIMEIAGADLCASFTLEFRRLPIKSAFILPEPSQLCKILFMCKQTLDTTTMCVNLNKELVTEYQKLYIRRTANKLLKTGFILDDLIGYREHALGDAWMVKQAEDLGRQCEEVIKAIPNRKLQCEVWRQEGSGSHR